MFQGYSLLYLLIITIDCLRSSRRIVFLLSLLLDVYSKTINKSEGCVCFTRVKKFDTPHYCMYELYSNIHTPIDRLKVIVTKVTPCDHHSERFPASRPGPPPLFSSLESQYLHCEDTRKCACSYY